MLKTVLNKNSKLSILFFSIFLFSFGARAEFICDATPQVYALEVVKLELSGRRYPISSKCLKQDSFKYIRVSHDPINELVGQDFLYADLSSLQIEQVEKVNDDLGHFRVDFSVMASPEGKEDEKRTDSVFFSLRKSGKWGCAQTLFSPSDLYLDRACK